MTDVVQSIRFHLKYGWFNVREQFSDLASGLMGFLLFPFFIWLISRVWERFNSYQGNYTFEEIVLYLGVTKVLFITFIRPVSISMALGDFSLSLAKPRSWLALSFSGSLGRCSGSRLVYLLIFIAVMPFLGSNFSEVVTAALRLIILLPFLGVIQALVGVLFASAQVIWTEISYFILPVSKIFLVLGGVFGPLLDFREPWVSILTALPPSDIFFQPAHFCVKGSFYQMSGLQWLFRIAAFCIVLWIFNMLLYRQARKHHQSYGG